MPLLLVATTDINTGSKVITYVCNMYTGVTWIKFVGETMPQILV